jgi:hypothetical protein
MTIVPKSLMLAPPVYLIEFVADSDVGDPVECGGSRPLGEDHRPRSWSGRTDTDRDLAVKVNPERQEAVAAERRPTVFEGTLCSTLCLRDALSVTTASHSVHSNWSDS